MTTKQLVKPSELPNPDNLGKDHLNALIGYLGHLREIDPEVARRAIRYVSNGSDEEVLLTLGGLKEAAKALQLLGISSGFQYHQYQQAARERARLLRPGTPVAPGVWIRLAHVFDAANRAAGNVPQTPPDWPSWLVTLQGLICASWHLDDRTGSDRPTWALTEMEAILRSADLSTTLFARTFLNQQLVSLVRVGYHHYGNMHQAYTGWNDYLSRHLETVRESLRPTASEQRLYVLRILNEMKFDFAPVVDLLVEYGIGSAKTVREAVLPLLTACRDQARPLVERALAEGDAGQRNEAALLLWRLGGHDAAAVLRERLANEPSERVKQTIEKLLAAPDEQSSQVIQDLTASLPPVQLDLGPVAFPEEGKKAVREALDGVLQQHLQRYEQSQKQWEAPDRPKWMSKPVRPERASEKALEALFQFVEGKANTITFDKEIQQYSWGKGPFGDWFAPPAVELLQVVRLAYGMGILIVNTNYYQGGLGWRDFKDLEAYRGRCPEPFGLRELDAAVATLPECAPGMIARAYLATNTRYHTFCDWEPDAIWPVYVEHFEALRELLGSKSPGSHDWWWPEKRRNAFRVLALFPQLPPGFVPLLWDIALGETKTDRPLAQAALATLPDKTSKIQVALRDGRQVVRGAAAEWLGKLGEPSAVGPLKEAFRQEKQEVVKGALMTALEACGADVREFLDRDALLAEAEAGLKKKRPRGMEWVPLNALPALHWQDNGQQVDPRVVQWWLVQSIQQKSPVCGPLLRRYLAMCRPHEVAALGKFVLSSWIGHDTRTPPQEVAAERARKDADQQWAMYGQQQFWVDFYKGNKDNLYRQLFQNYSNEFMGSAIEQKGILALVAAGGDAECVKLCDQYIRKYFGSRLAQCKCLVEVLAWSAHPLAIQVLLSFANRFRTKAVRKAAEEHVQALADREGWTIDELADRTVPDAGFARTTGEDGNPVGTEAVLGLDYGPRKFTVRLDDELQPVVATEGGKTVKNLPAPGKQDDAELAKAARKTFTDARKTVKEVVKRQAERFYEALCTQRAWRSEDWRRFLTDHPIVGKLCVRLAWAAFAPADGEGGSERFLGCFRPLEDGTLTNAADEEVKFDPNTLVRLAHTCNTPAELAAAWVRHFEDYDVPPLFQQFGRTTYTLSEEKKKETDLNDFEGHLLTTFRLRGKATKLGYIRGDAEDGGCFYLYRKPFPSLGVQASVGFTGSMLPEQDVPAALGTLYFTSIKGDKEAASSWQPSKLPLGKVPPVLLSECYNDVKQIAAEGSGYDPEWRKKSYF